jgi:hypothetical protein
MFDFQNEISYNINGFIEKDNVFAVEDLLP